MWALTVAPVATSPTDIPKTYREYVKIACLVRQTLIKFVASQWRDNFQSVSLFQIYKVDEECKREETNVS